MCNICRASVAINITRRTYYNWLDKFPKFKEQVEEVKESLNDMVESQLLKNAEKGNQKTVEFYLINRKKNKYSNKQNIKITKPKIVKETVFVQSRKSPKNRI
jgi:hypothetical protein